MLLESGGFDVVCLRYNVFVFAFGPWKGRFAGTKIQPTEDNYAGERKKGILIIERVAGWFSGVLGQTDYSRTRRGILSLHSLEAPPVGSDREEGRSAQAQRRDALTDRQCVCPLLPWPGS